VTIPGAETGVQLPVVRLEFCRRLKGSEFEGQETSSVLVVVGLI
jgi:hypothetical protein